MGTRLHIVVSEELLARVDGALGPGQPRADFIRRAVEQALSEAKEPIRRKQADLGSVSSSEGVRSAAPAEQPSRALPHYNEGDTLPPARSQSFSPLGARSSLAAKRDVRPISKKGER